jgi:SAM-dependent methyltransferase
MGDALGETIILNRQKVFSEFDTLDSQEQIISGDLCKRVSELYNSMFHGRAVYECGCGYGTSIKDFGFQLYQYRGIDPSKRAIAKFKDNHPDFVNRVFNMSFEESVNYWSKGDAVVLATYGAASYFMHQYLEILGKSGQDFFLMFYKDKYCPQVFQDMHHFSYSDDYLRSAFPNSNIMPLDAYRIVSSKEFI